MAKTPANTKTCAKCGVQKPIEGNFNRREASSDGYRATCRVCDAATRASWEAKNPSKAQKAPSKAAVRVPRFPEAASEGLPTPEETSETPALPSGGTLEGASGASEPSLGPSKVIGRIGGVPGEAPRVTEVATDPLEEADKAAAREYAALLNKRLPIRVRARLMVKIAKNTSGMNAALALKAISDINLATGVVTKTGARTESGPIFALPADTAMKMGEK